MVVIIGCGVATLMAWVPSRAPKSGAFFGVNKGQPLAIGKPPAPSFGFPKCIGSGNHVDNPLGYLAKSGKIGFLCHDILWARLGLTSKGNPP